MSPREIEKEQETDKNFKKFKERKKKVKGKGSKKMCTGKKI